MPDYPTPIQKQPNVVTSARYEYSLWEKRVIYQVLGHLLREYNKGVSETDLFNNRVIRMPLKSVIMDDKDKLRHAKKAVISLRMKSFEIVENEGQENERWQESGFIYRSRIEDGIVEVVISELIMPHLIDLTKEFTRYSPYTAMILRSSYSQRFYEFCCRFRDTGHWHVSLDELRAMLRLEDKYATYGELKKYVLDKAQKELQELYDNNESDVCFVYDELKTKRAITHLHIRIKAKEKNKGAEESTADELQLMNQYIKSFWPDDNQERRRTQVFNELNKRKAFKEFMKKADDICARYQSKRPPELAGILIIALKEDFGLIL